MNEASLNSGELAPLTLAENKVLFSLFFSIIFPMLFLSVLGGGGK